MLKNTTGEKLHTIPEHFSPSSSQVVYSSEDKISPAQKDRFSSIFSVQFQSKSAKMSGQIEPQKSTSKIQLASPQVEELQGQQENINLNNYSSLNSLKNVKSFNQNPMISQTNQLFELSQDQYAKENEKLRQRIEEINEIQQRKRTNSNVLEPKQAENILDQYKGLSANYNNAQQRMLELEKSLLTKSEVINKQNEQITNLNRVVKYNMESLGLNLYIKDLHLSAKENEVDILTEIANIKILVDSSRAEKHEQDEWMEEQNIVIGSLQEEIAQLKSQNQATVDLTQNMNSELKNAVDALNMVQKENSALLIDKEALLDYIEEIKVQYERCTQENLELKNYKIDLEDKINLIGREAEDLRLLVRDLEQKASENERDKKTRDLQEKHSIQLSTNEIETLKREKDRLSAQLVSATQESASFKQLLDSINSKNEKEGRAADIAIEKMQSRENNLIQSLRQLEEAILKLNREKEVNLQVIQRMKEFIQDKEVVQLIEEIANIQSEQVAIEREKNMANVQIFQLEAKASTMNSGGEYEQKLNKNRIDGLRDIKKQYENNQQILLQKQQNLEGLFLQKIEFERGKALRMQQIEKVNAHLKNDLSVLKNDIDMKEISRKNIESAYNILLTDYKRLTSDPNLLQSRQKAGEYQQTATTLGTISIINTSSNSLAASRKVNQPGQQFCSPQEQSQRKIQSVSIPYNVYENYDESLNNTKGSVKSSGITQSQFTYNPNNRNSFTNNYQFD